MFLIISYKKSTVFEASKAEGSAVNKKVEVPGNSRKGRKWRKMTKSEILTTVTPRNTGPKSNGNPPITNAKLWSLQDISFNFLYWQ